MKMRPTIETRGEDEKKKKHKHKNMSEPAENCIPFLIFL